MSTNEELYPDIDPYRTGRVAVSDVHTLYYEECGNPSGSPAVVLHGGPGSGTTPRDRRFFDPEQYRVILLHQRGAGKSTPPAELKENTTWHLVEDLEVLRKHLHIDSWLVFGGSWGGALALIYAISHPGHVRVIVVYSAVLGTKFEEEWMFTEMGSARVFPEQWEMFVHDIPQAERRSIIDAYGRRLLGSSDPATVQKYARAWNLWEMSITSLVPRQEFMEKVNDPIWNLQHAVTECQYITNGYFLPNPNWVLDNLTTISHIPATVIHGRYDMVISAKNAWEIHKRWPEADFVIVPTAGHTSLDKGMETAILGALDKYRPKA